MNFNIHDLWLMLPEDVLLGATCAILLIDLFIKPSQRAITHLLSLIAVVGPMLLILADHDAATIAFNGAFVPDGIAAILKIFILGITAAVFVYARRYLVDRGLFIGEYYLLCLFATIGMMLLVSAGSLVMAYLGLELFALSTYALVAINRDSGQASEAAMKYFVLGALASGLLLYGMSMIYGATGTLDLAKIHAVGSFAANDPHAMLLAFGVVCLVVGIGFKFGAAPFHMWLPDVYEGSPTAVTIFVGSAPKIAAFGMAYRLLEMGLGDISPQWRMMIAALAVASLAIGNVVAIAQTNIKRLLAYSTISHVGYVLLGILSGTAQGYQAAMFYMISYVIVAGGSFGMVLLLARQGFEADKLTDYKGLNAKSPWFAGMMAMLMFSLAGVPPFIGFWAKLGVVQAVLGVHLTWLGVVAVLFSVVGAFFYLRIVKLMYFDEPVDVT